MYVVYICYVLLHFFSYYSSLIYAFHLIIIFVIHWILRTHTRTNCRSFSFSFCSYSFSAVLCVCVDVDVDVVVWPTNFFFYDHTHKHKYKHYNSEIEWISSKKLKEKKSWKKKFRLISLCWILAWSLFSSFHVIDVYSFIFKVWILYIWLL